jgi:drug/metabolite transporter (DMT)-like permease
LWATTFRLRQKGAVVPENRRKLQYSGGKARSGTMGLLDEPVLLALCASCFFGLALVLTQFGLRHMRPGEGVLISIPLVTAIAWASVPVVGLEGWDSRAAAIFLAVGLVYPAVVTMLTYEANDVMGPGVAGALGNLAPLFAVLGAIALFGDLPGPLQVLGILTIVLGIVLLSVSRGGTSRAWPLWALALPLAASVIRGAAQPVGKIGLAAWPSSFAAVLLGFTASAIVVIVVAAARHRGLPTGFSRRGILWFCCVGLSNGFAVLALYAALTRGSVVLVAPLAATYPLVTLALGAMLLRSERLTVATVAGIAITVVGVAMLLGK